MPLLPSLTSCYIQLRPLYLGCLSVALNEGDLIMVLFTQVFVLPLQLLVDQTLLFQLMLKILDLLLHRCRKKEIHLKNMDDSLEQN